MHSASWPCRTASCRFCATSSSPTNITSWSTRYRKLDDEDLMAIVGGSFGPDGGASYVEIANVRNIRKRNEEIAAQHNC